MASQIDITKLQTILTTGKEETKMAVYCAVYFASNAKGEDIAMNLNEIAPFDVSLYNRFKASFDKSKVGYLKGESIAKTDDDYFCEDTLGVFGLNPTVIDGVKAVNDNYKLFKEAYHILLKV